MLRQCARLIVVAAVRTRILTRDHHHGIGGTLAFGGRRMRIHTVLAHDRSRRSCSTNVLLPTPVGPTTATIASGRVQVKACRGPRRSHRIEALMPHDEFGKSDDSADGGPSDFPNKSSASPSRQLLQRRAVPRRQPASVFGSEAPCRQQAHRRGAQPAHAPRRRARLRYRYSAPRLIARALQLRLLVPARIAQQHQHSPRRASRSANRATRRRASAWTTAPPRAARTTGVPGTRASDIPPTLP